MKAAAAVAQRMSVDQFREYQRTGRMPGRKRKSKFRNIRCKSRDGKNFASQIERDYYEQLLLRWEAGDVLWFIRQPRFDLEGGVEYRGDFLVVSALNAQTKVEVIDTKGHQTPDSKNKIKQLKVRYDIDVQLVRRV